MPAEETVADMGGQLLKLTNLNKVLYPTTRTRKSEIIAYYAQVATAMLPHVAGRPVTRKRWPNGTAAPSFFQKNVDHATPTWMARQAIAHSDGDVIYPLIDTPAGLAWMGQNGALELHVPQWRFDADGVPGPPDRMVFDLDPGPGVTLVDCAVVARRLRERLAGDGLDLFPVTSGAKGLHLYARLDPGASSDEISGRAHEIAQEIEQEMPQQVTSKMTKAVRSGRIFIDWSQNSAAKTTIAPYSLRGRDRPTVATPRTWAELEEEDLGHLEFTDVLRRLDRIGDLLADLDPDRGSSGSEIGSGVGPDAAGSDRASGSAKDADGDGPGSPTPAAPVRIRPAAVTAQAVSARLATYREKRDAARTPEPVPAADAPAPQVTGDSFVIQEHHARALHWDLRLERDGVLVSYALPKGIPTDGRQNRLAVNTEDHPLEYATFEGRIPSQEYGGGRMVVWDRGTYETEKWRHDEVIVTLHGARATGRYALIRTRGNQWLMHRTKGQTPLEPVEPLTDDELEDRLGPLTVPDQGTAARAGSTADPTSTSPAPGADESVPASVVGGRAASSRVVDPPASGETGAASTASPTGRNGSPPTDLTPMLASPGKTATVADTDRWRYEGKWDGIRALARFDGELTITSRTGRNITALYPELAELAELLDGHRAVIDGEIVVLDENGRSVFNLMQDRMNLSRPVDVERVRRIRPVLFWVFDVLWLDGVSLLNKPFDLRRTVLEAMPLDGRAVSVPALLDLPLDEALAVTAERGWEGIIAKRGDSVYQPGKRNGHWVKLKHQQHQEVVLVGWTPGTGRRAGTIGALVLAVPDGAGWRYVGKVGTGFTDSVLDDLLARLTPLRRQDSVLTGDVPRDVVRETLWIEPALVAEIGFAEWTRDGVVRFPVWRGLRHDKTPSDLS